MTEETFNIKEDCKDVTVKTGEAYDANSNLKIDLHDWMTIPILLTLGGRRKDYNCGYSSWKPR